MNMNSIGSVTPVKKTASPADKKTGLYAFFLSSSTDIYIATAIPINEASDVTTCPSLKRAGTTLLIKSLYPCVLPACFKLTRSVIQASQSGS